MSSRMRIAQCRSLIATSRLERSARIAGLPHGQPCLARDRRCTNRTGWFTRAAVANADEVDGRGSVQTAWRLGRRDHQNKVSQELPPECDAEQMKARVARQRRAANAQILEMNRRVERMEIGSATSMIQKLKSRTSADRLYLSCVLGRGLQFSVPKTEFDAKLSELRRQNSVEEFQSGYASAKTSEPSTQHYIDPHYRTYYAPAFTPPAPRRVDNSAITTNSTAASPRFEPFRPIRNALSRNQSPETPEHDLVVRFHQSAPNNAATIALTGAFFARLRHDRRRYPALPALILPTLKGASSLMSRKVSATSTLTTTSREFSFALTRFSPSRCALKTERSQRCCAFSCDADGTEWAR